MNIFNVLTIKNISSIVLAECKIFGRVLCNIRHYILVPCAIFTKGFSERIRIIIPPSGTHRLLGLTITIIADVYHMKNISKNHISIRFPKKHGLCPYTNEIFIKSQCPSPKGNDWTRVIYDVKTQLNYGVIISSWDRFDIKLYNFDDFIFEIQDLTLCSDIKTYRNI